MCAHTHAHIYIWLLASNSHCSQLAFTPTLPSSALVLGSLVLALQQAEQQEGTRQLSWAQCDIASVPAAQSSVVDGQVQPLTLREVVCPAQERSCQKEVSARCSCAEWKAQRARLGQVYVNPHRNKSHKLHSCLKFWAPDPQCKARRIS